MNMLKQSYEVEVLINGKAAKEYAHKGKVYIEGREGTSFSIRIRNNSWSRKLFVPTIDGLSVMNGEEGSFDSSGYLVQAYSSITIDGWRTSDKDVASFYFSSPEGSYRKRMKKGDNLGIIGVAVFEERNNSTYTTVNYPKFYSSGGSGTWPWYPNKDPNIAWTTEATRGNTISLSAQAQCYSSLNCSNTGSAPTQQLGTGWGEQKNSEVTTVSFDRENHPDAVLEIYYNTREELQKEGINFKKEPLYVASQAFPGQYCRPPKTCSCNGENQGCTSPGCSNRN